MRDILLGLSNNFRDPRKIVESSVYMREPILLRWFNKGIDVPLGNLRLVGTRIGWGNF